MTTPTTDGEAIALLDALSAEARAEESALAGARADFSAARQALTAAMADVDARLASMERHVRYVHDRYGA